MKKIACVFLMLLLLNAPLFADCPCGPGCKCPPGACPSCCVVGTQTRTSHCFTMNLLGSLFPSVPARAVIYVPPATDPAVLGALQRLQDQAADAKFQYALDRQAQTAWQQQQLQMQVLAGQQAQLLMAVQNGKLETTETRQLLNQMITAQQALMNAIQNQPPIIVQPSAIPSTVPAVPMQTLPSTTPPATTTPALGTSCPNGQCPQTTLYTTVRRGWVIRR